MTKNEFIQILHDSEKDVRLNAVLDGALGLIRDSPTFRWTSHSDQLEYGQEATHYFGIYSHRLEMQRKRGRLTDGIEESVRTFADAGGFLALFTAEIEGRLVFVWFDQTQKIVGCVVPRLLDSAE